MTNQINLPEALIASVSANAGIEEVESFKEILFSSIMPPKNGRVNVAELTAFLSIAKEYGLNPITKEIYAFPSKGVIIPIVGVDGWAKIINSNPQFNGMEFQDANGSCTCKIYRKDRAFPTVVTEYLEECFNGGKQYKGPWDTHPKRMLRHKTMIQCARLAFGLGGIYDEDEANRIDNSARSRSEMVNITPRTEADERKLNKMKECIYELMDKTNADENVFLTYFKVSGVDELNEAQSKIALQKLETKLKAMEGSHE